MLVWIDGLAFPMPSALFFGQNAMGAAGGGGHVHLGQPAFMFANDLTELRIPRKVRPFVWIGLVVVKFFGTVRVTDIPPALGADGVIPLVVRRNRRPRTGRARISQLRHETVAFQSRLLRQIAKFIQRRIEVQKFHGLAATRGLGNAGPGKNQWDASRSLPKRVLTGDVLLAEVPTVIAP